MNISFYCDSAIKSCLWLFLYNGKEELTRQEQSVYFIIVFGWHGNKMCWFGVCKFKKGLEIMVDAKRTTQVIWKLREKKKKNL